MVEGTAFNTIEVTCLENCHSSSGDVFFDGDGCLCNCKFWDFCRKDPSSGVISFLKRLITHLSWILEELEEVTAVLKVWVVLEAILEVVAEASEMRCLSFLIWVFLYCRNVFSLLPNMVFCRFVKVCSSSFCCLLHLVFQHKRQLTLHTLLIFIYIDVSSLCSHLSNFKKTESLDLHLQGNT